MKKCRVVIATYSWSCDLLPRLKSCHAIEGVKKLTIRLGYKLNHRTYMFVYYVAMPIEKIHIKYKSQPIFEIEGYSGLWRHSIHNYPFSPYYQIGGNFEGHCRIIGGDGNI